MAKAGSDDPKKTRHRKALRYRVLCDVQLANAARMTAGWPEC